MNVTQLVDLGLARSVQLDGRPRIRVESQPGGVQLIIAATDRLGLFSDTAGLLASHSVQVRSAVLHTVEGVAVNTWRVDKQVPTDLPDTAYLVKQLNASRPVRPASWRRCNAARPAPTAVVRCPTPTSS